MVIITEFVPLQNRLLKHKDDLKMSFEHLSLKESKYSNIQTTFYRDPIELNKEVWITQKWLVIFIEKKTLS